MAGWVYVIAGMVAGALLGFAVFVVLRRHSQSIAKSLLDETEQARAAELASLNEQIKTVFAALSREALSANADDFLKLAATKFEQQTAGAEQSLDGKKALIDAKVEEMSTKLATLTTLIDTMEKDRAHAAGSLQGQLEKATQETKRLHETTAQLRDALANPQRRGQWGERMAEDVLRLAGLTEGISYFKQQVLEDGGKPDFTFPLPGHQCVHMDVKFPLANYLKVLDAADDNARATYTAQFLGDVRRRIKEVTSRTYIDPAGGTVECVLVFIPNEQVYGFIHEHDPSLLDDALQNKVVLCSPFSLYAILTVIRQSMDNFRFEQNSRRILEIVAEFRKHWTRYVESMEKMGRRIADADETYRELASTRTRQLDRQLDKIDDMIQARSATSATLPCERVNESADFADGRVLEKVETSKNRNVETGNAKVGAEGGIVETGSANILFAPESS